MRIRLTRFIRVLVPSFRQWFQPDIAKLDVGSFGLQANRAFRLAALSDVVDQVAVDPNGDLVAIANDFVIVPFADRASTFSNRPGLRFAFLDSGLPPPRPPGQTALLVRPRRCRRCVSSQVAAPLARNGMSTCASWILRADSSISTWHFLPRPTKSKRCMRICQ